MLILEKELPELTGSEKQIIWGTNVRKEIIESIREIGYGKPLYYHKKDENLENQILKRMEDNIKTISLSQYWIDIDDKCKKAGEKKCFPYYYQMIRKELLEQPQEESSAVVTKEADAYVCARYDKRRDGGVGVYAINLVVDGESEQFTKVFKEDIGLADIKSCAVQEIFKLCSKRRINHLNLHYDFDRIRDWCTGGCRCGSDIRREMKFLYERFIENNTVNFVVIDRENPDEHYKKAVNLAYQTIYKVR